MNPFGRRRGSVAGSEIASIKLSVSYSPNEGINQSATDAHTLLRKTLVAGLAGTPPDRHVYRYANDAMRNGVCDLVEMKIIIKIK